MVEFGPISLIAIGFPNIDKLKGELLAEIFRLSDAKVIRVIGLLAVVKDDKGKIVSAQISELSPEDRMKLGAAIGALIGFGAAGERGAMAGAEAGAQRVADKVAQKDFGLSHAQIMAIARDMPNGTAAGFMLIEHLWAKKFKEIAFKQEGVLLANGFISPGDLVALGASLADGAKTAEKVRLK